MLVGMQVSHPLFWIVKVPDLSSQIAHGWTAVNGHFLQMGRFVIDEPGKKSYTLSSEHLESLLERQEIMFPSTSAAEIEDKSKDDFLAKGVATLQTLYFVTQCIARGVQGLAIIVTLAFAVFNGITYYLWWNKPLDVRCPVHLQLIGQKPSKNSQEIPQGHNSDSTIWQSCLDVLNAILDLLFFDIVDDIKRGGALWALRKRLMLLVRPFVYAREILYQNDRVR